jgi:4-amino-4-deoxy-L-arabinose transferase|tara:strand:- start:154 stop:1728 length:1575 start_codon:yes stop_codon:yes gene_type:complete
MLFHFPKEQFVLLIVAGVLLATSILFFSKKEKTSLLFLFSGTMVLGFFFALLDPYINIWDEQFHALVAKNLSENPFTPTLYKNPIMPYDYKNWVGNHIWLHKQPLFLWQMALSIKLFGANELAVRIPSIVMHAIIPLFIFRIGSYLINARTGFSAAIIFANAFYPLELISGGKATDHNDIAFLFYVTASFWAWFEYEKSKNKYWLIVIGVLSGCAVLVKWLVGGLVYLAWFTSSFIKNDADETWLKRFGYLLFSGVVALLVFVPWQVYTFIQFPGEAAYEHEYNARHLTEAIEGHGGDIYFHFDEALGEIYGLGDLVPIALLVGFISLLFLTKSKKYKIFIFTTVVVVYSFYSFAATKMGGFTLIASPFLYLGLGAILNLVFVGLEKIIKWKSVTWVISCFGIGLFSWSALEFNLIQYSHTYKESHDPRFTNRNRGIELAEIEIIKSLDCILKKEDYVIFNARLSDASYVPIMFYTNYEAYAYIPNQSDFYNLKSKKQKMAFFDYGKLPEYIIKDKSVVLIPSH